MASRALIHLKLVTLGDPAQLSGGYLYQQRMAAEAPAHGAQLAFVSIPRRRFPLAIGDSGAQLRRLGPTDAVLLDSIVAAMAAPWLRRIGRMAPVVAVVHQQPGGVDAGPLWSAIQRRLDLIAYRRVTAVIAVSDFLANELRGLGIDASRITVIPPGRDPAQEQPVVPTGDLRSGRAVAAICVSNWTRNKGLHWLLEAAAVLNPATVTLHLVGETAVNPAYSRAIRARIARDDLRKRVVVHGRVRPAELAGMLQGADLLVHPSRHESYGGACAEAMAAGLPVIASRVDNLPYLIRDGIDGILITPGDVPKLAAAIAVLATDEARRKQMGASARSRAMARPTWNQSADRFFAAIRGAIAGAAPGS
ncbi:MAG TPA: glycosyltransferase family 4 protein [Candidatus Dormibacteraeota bacterium]|nr:glycosyltransferase family 4 protein [Candidatus Dormibacteraeota bacterium]